MSLYKNKQAHDLLEREWISSAKEIIKGNLEENVKLSSLTWFQVGGPSSLFFRPFNPEELSAFLKIKPPHEEVFYLGAGSNIIIRDGGFKGIIVKLGKNFSQITIKDSVIIAGGGALARTTTLHCLEAGLSGLEFLIGIPGTIGGVVAMNAGAYGSEVKDRLLWAECILSTGELVCLTPLELKMKYRSGELPEGACVTQAAFQGESKDPALIEECLNDYLRQRADSQPIKGKTGGSTFKNPNHPKKAWQLIDEAGCRGLQWGGAQVSPKHCNFLLNLGGASAHDLETLGEQVKKRVFEHSGVDLEWEIMRLGHETNQ